MALLLRVRPLKFAQAFAAAYDEGVFVEELLNSMLTNGQLCHAVKALVLSDSKRELALALWALHI